MVGSVGCVERLDGSAFDFWLGTWDCSFEGRTAKNSTTRDFGGHFLTERFQGPAPQPLVGDERFDVYNPNLNLWCQTWVDESGSYWYFVGSLVNSNPSFGTPEPVNAEGRRSRSR